MRLVAKQDVEAPAVFVFQQLSDFDSWERAAMRRGADVERSATPAKPGTGTSWRARFDYRGKPRQAQVMVEALEAPALLVLAADSPPAGAGLQIDIVDLTMRRTRIEVRLEIKPKTLAARLFLQSLRLARSRVERRFSRSIEQLAAEIEDRYRRSQRQG